MASRNINKDGIKTTIDLCLDYIGPSVPNAYLLRIVEGDRDEFGQKAKTTVRSPFTVYLGREVTTVEMTPGKGRQYGKFNFSVKSDTDLDEGDLIEIDSVRYIVDVLKPIDIGDGRVMKAGILIRRRDD